MLPTPLGVMVIVPLYVLFGVTVKLVLAERTLPDDGPVNVKLLAGTNGVTELLAEDSAEFPTTLVALTVNVYATPFVKPVTVSGDVKPVPVKLPGVEIALYCVIADPPSEFPANVIDAEALRGVAVPIVGTLGATAIAV